MDSVETACQIQVSDGGRFARFHSCGRPVKEDGLCGIHLAARRRREANHEAYMQRRADSAAAHDSAKDACARLADLGIKAYPHFSSFGNGNGGHTGGVVIEDPALLLTMLGRDS